MFDHGCDARLLQHDLRDPHPVRITVPAPRQIAGMRVVPCEERSPEIVPLRTNLPDLVDGLDLEGLDSAVIAKTPRMNPPLTWCSWHEIITLPGIRSIA